jgi:DNA-binding XRE family transcriptional regulator
MKTAENFPLQVRIVGFGAPMRKKLEEVWRRVVFENWTLAECQNVAGTEISNSLWVVELNQQDASCARPLRNFLDRTKSNCPIFLLSEWGREEEKMSSLLQNLLELFGAKVFVGEQGFDGLCNFLGKIAEKNPTEIIVDVSVSDDGLHVSFADNNKALIPLSEVRRLAESKAIVWDSIRIAGDRTYVTVADKNTESMPIPHDVLREFVTNETSKRAADTIRERKLTARTLGVTLRAARRRMGFSQEDLAARAGTSRWTIHRVEKGMYMPKVSLLDKLSRVLNQKIEDLLVH